ncbi:hypothetical protein F5Y08DRAFT_320117 [Xylaria arbuscula]|nr:hypothetical protein F5Y08DRAFT_320117 [Xylaria arbuscula]
MESGSRPLEGLVPVSGAALYAREMERRRDLRSRGVVATGCSEIDDALLLGGGFERGCVVGASAEELDFGVLLGLQTIARALVFEDRPQTNPPLPQGEKKQKATIITTMPATTILPILRDVVRCQVQAKLGPRNTGVNAELRRCLEAISISRIFDIDGLWEVLRELEPAQDKARISYKEVMKEEATTVHTSDQNREEKGISEVENVERSVTSEHREEEGPIERSPEQENADQATVGIPEPSQQYLGSLPERITELPPLRIGPELRAPVRRAEVLDSEDEEPLSSSPLSSPPPSTIATVSLSQFEEQQPQSPVEEEPQLSSSPLSSPPPSTVAPESPSQSEEQSQDQSQESPRQSPRENSQPLFELEPQYSPSPNPEPEERPQITEASPSITTENAPPPIPGVILITHFSALLTTLFTHSDKPSAHQNLQNLSSHLRHLAQSAGSLIMLLNSTTSPTRETSSASNRNSSTSTSTSTSAGPNNPPQVPPPENQQPQRPIEATLRSIFNPAIIPHHFQGYNNDRSIHAAASRLTRRNKPSFGATFAQFLDMHLLCSKVPRTRDNAETAVALLGAAGSEDVKYAWAVEALLDEGGFWDWDWDIKGGGKGKAEDENGRPPRRVNREQRWAAVDVRDRVVIVDAFGGGSVGGGTVSRGPIRLAAGFGGRRV